MDKKEELEICKELVNFFVQRKMKKEEIIIQLISALCGTMCVFPEEYHDDVFRKVVLELKKDFDNLKKRIKLEEEEQ